MENPKFQIKKSKDEQYYFVLKAKNGEPILNASEMYTTKQACKDGIASVKTNAPYDSRYDKHNNTESYSFRLTAANGKIIGKSESYKTSQSRDNGIEAVKRDAPDANTEDLA